MCQNCTLAFTNTEIVRYIVDMKSILWGYAELGNKCVVDPKREQLAALIYFIACIMEARGIPPEQIASTVAHRYGLNGKEAHKAVFDILKHRTIYENGTRKYPKYYSIIGVCRAFYGGLFDKFGGGLVVAKRNDSAQEVWLGLCESDSPYISEVRNVMIKALPKDAKLSFVVPPNITPCKGFYRKLLDAVHPTNIIINDDRALFPWFNDYQDFLSVVMYHSEISIDKHLFIVNQHYEKKIFRESQFDWYVPQYPWSEEKGSNNGESLG